MNGSTALRTVLTSAGAAGCSIQMNEDGTVNITKAIEIMRNELRVTLALTGTSTIDAVGPHILRMPAREPA